MDTIVKLRRDRRGRPVWPDQPIQSTTARQRPSRQAEAAARKAAQPRLWDVTVVAHKHSRLITVAAKTKPAACTLAIAEYRKATRISPQTSVLVDRCVPSPRDPNRPDAA